MVAISFWLTSAIVCAVVLQDATLAAPHATAVNAEKSLNSDRSNQTLTEENEEITEDMLSRQNKTLRLDNELLAQSANAENKTLVKRHFCKKCGGGGGYGGKVIIIPVKQYGGGGGRGCCGSCGGCGGGGGGGSYAYASASASASSYGR